MKKNILLIMGLLFLSSCETIVDSKYQVIRADDIINYDKLIEFSDVEKARINAHLSFLKGKTLPLSKNSYWEVIENDDEIILYTKASFSPLAENTDIAFRKIFPDSLKDSFFLKGISFGMIKYGGNNLIEMEKIYPISSIRYSYMIRVSKDYSGELSDCEKIIYLSSGKFL